MRNYSTIIFRHFGVCLRKDLNWENKSKYFVLLKVLTIFVSPVRLHSIVTQEIEEDFSQDFIQLFECMKQINNKSIYVNYGRLQHNKLPNDSLIFWRDIYGISCVNHPVFFPKDSFLSIYGDTLLLWLNDSMKDYSTHIFLYL